VLSALIACVCLDLVRDTDTCDAPIPQQIRIQDCSFASAVATGLEHSPTLRREFDRVAELHGIVYVQTGVYASLRHKELRGALLDQVAVAEQTCVLRINLKRQTGPQGIASLAHELQHALEVLQAPEARSEKTIEALFQRIGTPTSDGVYETREALATEAQVLREVRTRPK
jgi:hypothetical protein